MALAVVAALAVRVVVLVVVGDQVGQGEAVVRGDEVDRRERAAAVVLVQVGAAGQARGELTEAAGLAAPEVAHGVAVLPVPLRPQGREVAHLVAAGADVPRLGDELDLADHRVLLHEVEEHRQPVDVVELPGQGGREVEPEPVDVHLGDPVPQRVHDQLQGVRIADVERVARARVVHVVLLVVLDQAVVRGVVDAPQRERRAHVVALGGVVVDDVEDDLDVGVVQVAHHRLELLHLRAGTAARRGVGVVGREEGDRVVAPVVREALLLQVVVVEELVDRHELHGGDPEPLVVLDHHRVREARVGAAQLLREIRVLHRQPAHVGLVDHRLVVRDARRAVAAPVEERVHHDRLRDVRRRVGVVARLRRAERVAEHRLVPLDGPVHRLGVRVDEQLRRVAPQAGGRFVRAVDAVAVPLAGLHARQVAVPDEAVDLGEVDPVLGAVLVEQAQRHRRRDLGEECEVGAGAVVAGAERVGVARPRPHGVLRGVDTRAARPGHHRRCRAEPVDRGYRCSSRPTRLRL